MLLLSRRDLLRALPFSVPLLAVAKPGEIHKLGEAPQLFVALMGLYQFYLVRAQHQMAREILGVLGFPLAFHAVRKLVYRRSSN